MAAVGALVVGAFGMNLNVEKAVGLGEDDEGYLFWAVFGAVVGSCVIGVAAMFLTVWYRGMLITTVSGVGGSGVGGGGGKGR